MPPRNKNACFEAPIGAKPGTTIYDAHWARYMYVQAGPVFFSGRDATERRPTKYGVTMISATARIRTDGVHQLAVHQRKQGDEMKLPHVPQKRAKRDGVSEVLKRRKYGYHVYVLQEQRQKIHQKLQRDVNKAIL